MKPEFLIGFLALSICTVFSIDLPQTNPSELKWWQEGIVYQVYPRSHQDSDGDGIGDLKGIESRLDHFVDIGITAVWISPIYKSPMVDFGYDISNFTDVEPLFGTLDDFKSLSAAMKQRGIKLIMDFVPNHSSDQHPWFIDSVKRIDPYTDYYVWKDPKGYDEEGNPIPPSNWISVFGGSMWEWNDERQQFYLHQFVKAQPDLNYENHAVLVEMLGAVKFWLDLGVDGFRVDAVPHMFETLPEDGNIPDEPVNPDRPPNLVPTDWLYYLHPHTYNLPQTLDALAEFRQLIDVYTAVDGVDRCMMVEVTMLQLDDLFKYYGTDERPIADFPFNFEFINRIKLGFTSGDIDNLVNEWFTKMPAGRTANWVLGNHDNHRVSARFGDSVIDPFHMIVHLLPGSSVTYYGEEIGMQNTFISYEDTVDPAGCNVGPDRYQNFSRDPERTPMQWDDSPNAGFSSNPNTWLPINENYVNLNVGQQEGEEESHLQIYKKISTLRKSETWKFGSLNTRVLGDGNVFAFSRIYNGHGFIVIANFGQSQSLVNANGNFPNIPDTATVYARSSGFVPQTTQVDDVISTYSIAVGAGHSLIITF